MNSKLVGTCQEWEVEITLKQMAPMKVPDPDHGLAPLFYPHFWPTIDGDVTSSILFWAQHRYITLTCKPYFYYPHS